MLFAEQIPNKNTHGGARKGSGRRKRYQSGERISVYLDKDLLKMIETEFSDETRSQTINDAVALFMETHKRRQRNLKS